MALEAMPVQRLKTYKSSNGATYRAPVAMHAETGCREDMVWLQSVLKVRAARGAPISQGLTSACHGRRRRGSRRTVQMLA